MPFHILNGLVGLSIYDSPSLSAAGGCRYPIDVFLCGNEAARIGGTRSKMDEAESPKTYRKRINCWLPRAETASSNYLYYVVRRAKPTGRSAKLIQSAVVVLRARVSNGARNTGPTSVEIRFDT